MINNPRPTRAEASDVANAVLDGTDCVMLSGETGSGKYPLESVNYMYRIIKSIEEKYPYNYYLHKHFKNEESDISDALGRASCLIAEQISAKAIIALTNSTYTAKKIAKYRPKVPIIGITNNDHTHRRLNFVWGVHSLQINDDNDYLNNFDLLKPYLIKSELVKFGDLVVFVSGLTENSFGHENRIKLYYI